jgi:CHAT domain-containing protein
VPDGPLYSVPWPALAADVSTRSEWIDQGPILVAESPRIREAGSAPTPPGGLRLLALGVDASPQARAAGLRALGHAEREAREISARWPEGNASLSVGETADRNTFLGAQPSRYDVIHISSHTQAYQGLADQTTLFVVGAAAAPVTAAEIRELDLRAELVFLSCCEAVGGVRRGVGPAHAGLARSFLDAGARHVIASGIRVDDEAARHLAVSFYEHWLDGASIQDALRMAQLDLRDGEARWAHPYYWAFYQVISP